MTRLHPFTFALAEVAEARFPDIRSQALGEEIDLSTFAGLRSVQGLLQDFGTPDLVAAAPQAAAEYLSLLFVGYRYWDSGKHSFQIDRDVLETTLAAPPTGAPQVPHGACYVEMPERWFWGQIDEGTPHEPIEGLFIAATHAEFTVVAVLGLRAERDGFSQITVTASGSDVMAAGSDARQPPFAPTMDGGETAGFKSVATQGELLHLSYLALATLTL
jgi:hypothetical protein